MPARNPGPSSMSGAAPIPEAIGGYRIERLLGEGGMAQVFLALQEREPEFRKRVVIKRILPAHAAEPEFVRWFMNEVRISSTMNHPKIVKVSDFGRDELGVPYMVMDYVPGADLGKLIEHHGGLPFPAVWAVLQDVAEAFVYAHSAGPDRAPLVHRDFSPQNLLIRPEGTAILSDFGLSKPLSDNEHQTGADDVKGKVHFFSPETLTHRINDVRTDLFSIGVTIYQAVTGALPFDGDTHFLVLQRIVAGERRAVRELRPDCPQPLVDVIDRLLRVDPTERYQSAGEMLRDLPPLASTSRIELGELVREAVDSERAAGAHPPSSSQGGPARSDLVDARPQARSSSSGTRPMGSAIPQAGDGRALVSSYQTEPEPELAGERRPAGSQAEARPHTSARWSLIAVIAAMGALAIVGVVIFAAVMMFPASPSERPSPASPSARTEPRPASEPTAPSDPHADHSGASEPVAPEVAATAGAAPEPAPRDTTAREPEPAAPSTDVAHARAPRRRSGRPVRARSVAASDSSALDEARHCLARGDRRCARDVLAARGRTPIERALLIDTYRELGQTTEMLDAMQAFVRRFPRAPQVARYREDLRRYGRL